MDNFPLSFDFPLVIDTQFILIASGIFLFLVYLLIFSILHKRITKTENKVIDTFLLKVSKIPGLIEVMRPFVANAEVFNTLTQLHSAAMIRKYDTIYFLLEHNARIHAEFSFLMKLSVQISELQKNAQFLYIRDFIIGYERNLKKDFELYNQEVKKWNRFVIIKNCTIIGLILPGRMKELI